MMATSNPRIDTDTLHAAADWWVRLSAPDMADHTIEQWLDWTAADERNLLAYERITALENQIGALAPNARQQLINEFASNKVPSRSWLPLAAAASVAAVSGVGGWLAWNTFGEGASQVYHSAVAQNQDITLPDGSKVALGGDSTLTARFARGQRHVELSKGEAFFQVVHDNAHPFVVSAGNVSIRDVGTAFDVRRTGQRVSIAVTEGRVNIAEHGKVGDSDSTSTGALQAIAGQLVSYDPATAAMSVTSTTPDQATAWRSDRLEFINEPLSVVVANINRYSTRPLRISDPDLQNLSFTGTINTRAIDSWLLALPQVFPLQVQARGDQVILSKAPHR